MAEKTNDTYVTTGNVNVRVRPTYDSHIVRTVEAGAEFEVEKTYSRRGVMWGKIKDTKEFICLNFCKKKAE